MFKERRILRNISEKIGNFSKNSKINISSNMIEGVYYQEVSLTRLKDRENMFQDRENMLLDRDNMYQNSTEGLKDLISKETIDKIETTIATRMIEIMTMRIESTIESMI